MTKRILLVYPSLGMSGSMVQHLPLSVLYAAIDSIKAGFNVEILDLRLSPDRWESVLEKSFSKGPVMLLGISVMSGAPIMSALKITRWAKQNYPAVPTVWGGPHATFNGSEILAEPSVDFVVSGYGSVPLMELARHLRGDEGGPSLEDIKGLSHRREGRVITCPPGPEFEIFDFRDIPYHLVEGNMNQYGQLDSSERIFSMYSVMGCPYQCAFCSSPAQYRTMRKKFEHLSPEQVADHIEFVKQRYGATYIYFIDDDSFFNLAHVEAIIDEIKRRGIKVRLGFRGARVNEIVRMSDDFLSKLAEVGTNIMHIGAESGSQRILDLIRKNCTVEDILMVNRKMARHPEIKTAYNWIVGLPGETLEDLRSTQRLVLQLIKENPSAIVFIPNKFRPLPNTELYDVAVAHGYRRPSRLEEWIDNEAEGDSMPPWYSQAQFQMIRMMQVTSYFVDNKINKVDTGKSFRFLVVRLLAAIYAPVARLRMRYGLSGFLLEYYVFQWFAKRFRV